MSVSPLTIFVLSWHLFCGNRRADDRALNVPKHALSIFLMMIPLASSVLYAGQPVEKGNETDCGGKPTAEQKRKEIKAITMKEGPRPKQIVLVAFIWLTSFFLAIERLFSTHPENRKPLSREYNIKSIDNSSKEIQIVRDMDITYCPVWNDAIAPHDIIVWVILVALPVIFGPLITIIMEIFFFAKKKCSRAQYPITPSHMRYWIIITMLSVILLGTYSTHLWLAEKYMKDYFQWNFFECLMAKYFLGSIDIMVIPLVIVTVDKQIRLGLGVVSEAKKKGTLSKDNSVCTNV